jgi:hypothetical protein
MRIRTLGAAAMVSLALGLVLTGCGSSGGIGVATAQKADASASPTASLSPDEMNAKFVDCLRAHGMKVDDSQPGKGVSINVTPKTEAVMKKATEACRAFDPAQNMSEEDKAKMKADALQFSVCMRKNGVEDYPDPDPDDNGITIKKGKDADPDFDAAVKTCQKELVGRAPKGGGPDGGPSTQKNGGPSDDKPGAGGSFHIQSGGGA